MIIGIDARMYGQGFGLARYVKQLVDGVTKSEPNVSFVIFCRKDNINSLPNLPNIKKILADIQWYSVKEQLLFPSIIKKEAIDLMHFPHWNVPYFYKGKYVVSIHDLTMFHYPRPEATTLGPLLFKIKDIAHRLLLKRVVKQAVHIITTSQFVSNDIHQTLQVSLEKMTHVYQASFLSESGKYSQESVTKKFNIYKPYLLYVGAAYPHKNVEGLLAAWQEFQEIDHNQHELFLVGKPTPFYEKIMNSELGHQAGVRYLKLVADNDLDYLYRGATAFVYPSLSEGFGLPPLEAMARSVPVISSNKSCLPEILGESAYYVDPTEINALAEAMVQVSTDKDLQFELSEKGKTLSEQYSWDRFISQIVTIYSKQANLE